MRGQRFRSSGALRLGLAAITIAALAALLPRQASAAIESRAILKTYFETGDVPTQAQFATLLDSMVNYTEDRYLLGLRQYDPTVVYNTGDTVGAKRFGVGDTAPASPLGYADPHIYNVVLEPDFAGHSGFLAMRLGDTAGLSYYGYLQLEMEASSSSGLQPPAIFVQYVAYETTPDTPITMSVVPEPAAGGLLLLGVALLRRRRCAR